MIGGADSIEIPPGRLGSIDVIPIAAACSIAGLLAGLIRRGGIAAMGGVTLFAIDHWRSGAYRGSTHGLALTLATIVFFAALGMPGFATGRLARRFWQSAP